MLDKEMKSGFKIPTDPRLFSRALATTLLSALISSMVSFHTPYAQADVPSATGKGIVGGGLLGAELGFLTLAAAGARPWWLYATIPPVTCAGGAIGGYFIERKVTPEVSIAMLAGGIALIIPTVVATLSATAYRPGPEENVPPDALPTSPMKVEVKTGQKPINSSAKIAMHRNATKPRWAPALVNYNDDQKNFQLSMPMIQIKPSYSMQELAQFGVPQRLEVHAPVVAVAF